MAAGLPVCAFYNPCPMEENLRMPPGKTMLSFNSMLRLAVIAFGLCFGSPPSLAQGDSSFAGKVVRIVIWSAPGGGFDLQGRLIARHLGRFLPGKPSLVAENMTGGGGVIAANYIFNIAPKDGTVLGVIQSSLPLLQVLGDPAVRFDSAKFVWIGNIAPTQENLVSWQGTGFDGYEDLLSRQFLLGASGAGSNSVIVPRAMNALLGTKIKLIMGFPGGNDVGMAMEKGEVFGQWNTWSSWKTTRPEWLRDGKIKVLVQSALHKPRDLQGPPLLTDLAKTPDDRQIFSLLASAPGIGVPLVAPPGLPDERKKILIDAYRAMVADPDFVADATKLRLDVAPVIGDNLQSIVAHALATPPALAERLKAISQ